MKKWIAYLTISSIVLGSMPVHVLADEVVAAEQQKTEELVETQIVETETPQVDLTEASSDDEVNEDIEVEEVGEEIGEEITDLKEEPVVQDIPVEKNTSNDAVAEAERNGEITKTASEKSENDKESVSPEEVERKNSPRKTGDFEVAADGIYLGQQAGINPESGGAYLYFNPTKIELVGHNDEFNGFNGGCYYYTDAPHNTERVLSSTIDIQEAEGDYHLALRATATGQEMPGTTFDNGALSYQILRTASEVTVTGQTGETVINGQGEIPMNPTSLTIGRPASDTYGDATFYWEIINSNGKVIFSGTTAAELPSEEELAELPGGIYELKNQVKETIPESSRLFEQKGVNGEELSVSANTSGKFQIAVKGTVVVKHYLEDETDYFASESTTEIVDEEYMTYPVTDIPAGYELDESKLPNNGQGQYIDGVIEVDYYYKKKETPVKVKYVYEDEDGLQVEFKGSAEEFIEKFKTPFETNSKDFEGYDLVTVNTTSGTVSADGKTVNGTHQADEVLVTYVYKKKATSVKVNHIDTDTKEVIAELEIIPGLFEDPYKTTSAKIPGYKLVVTPDNAEGNYSMNTPEVTYEYAKIVPKIIVHFVDEKGNKISTSLPEKDGVWGEDYETTPKTIEGYELVVGKIPANADGTFGDDDVEVTYVYKKKATQVIVNHQFVDGKEFAKDVLIDGFYNDDYQTKPVIKPGYVIVKVIGETVGKHGEVIKEITYVYAEMLPPLVHPTMEGGKIVTGTGIPNTDIEITFPDGTVKKGHVDNQGNWTMDVPTGLYLKEGDHIKAVTVDYLTGLRSTVAIGPVIPLSHPILPKPENPDKDKETPQDSDVKSKGTTPPSKSNNHQNKLPQTGEKLMKNTLFTGMSLIVLAAGYYVFNRKKNNEK
ncbi:MucBP domain-containing protein [Vagococcus salmoninarum]|uniref:MucBP domain-containing protein n=1 Tax=Vagococcus salmoninarum TaxID=2739 RepID=UPI003F9E2EEA